MLFNYLPRPIQRMIDLAFFMLLIVLGVAFLNVMTPENSRDAERVMQMQHEAMRQTGLVCIRVILAEPGRIDCHDGSGRTVLMHTDAAGWIEQ